MKDDSGVSTARADQRPFGIHDLHQLAIELVIVPRVLNHLTRNACMRSPPYQGYSGLLGFDAGALRARFVAGHDSPTSIWHPNGPDDDGENIILGAFSHDLHVDYWEKVDGASSICYHDPVDVGLWQDGLYTYPGVLHRKHRCLGLSSHDCMQSFIGLDAETTLGFAIVYPRTPADPDGVLSGRDAIMTSATEVNDATFRLTTTSRTLNNGKFENRGSGQLSEEVTQALYKSLWNGLRSADFGCVFSESQLRRPDLSSATVQASPLATSVRINPAMLMAMRRNLGAKKPEDEPALERSNVIKKDSDGPGVFDQSFRESFYRTEDIPVNAEVKTLSDGLYEEETMELWTNLLTAAENLGSMDNGELEVPLELPPTEIQDSDQKYVLRSAVGPWEDDYGSFDFLGLISEEDARLHPRLDGT